MAKVNVNDLIGMPFKKGGRGPYDWDCQGLAIEVFRRYGIDLVDSYTGGMSNEEKAKLLSIQLHEHINIIKDWEQIKKPEEPCLITMRGAGLFINHLGVYIGNKKFIQVTNNALGGAVCINKIKQPPWKDMIIGYYRKRK